MANTQDKAPRGLAITAFVLGIIAFIGAFVPFFNVITGFLALIAIVVGIIAIVKKQGWMGITGLVLAIVSFLVGFVANFFGTAGMIGAGLGAQIEKNLNVEGLDVTSYQLEASATPAVVTGTLVNNTDTAVSLPVIAFNAYDESGNQLDGSCADMYFQELAVGDTWSFSAVCDEGMTPASVELDAVTHLDLDLSEMDVAETEVVE